MEKVSEKTKIGQSPLPFPYQETLELFQYWGETLDISLVYSAPLATDW